MRFHAADASFSSFTPFYRHFDFLRVSRLSALHSISSPPQITPIGFRFRYFYAFFIADRRIDIISAPFATFPRDHALIFRGFDAFAAHRRRRFIFFVIHAFEASGRHFAFAAMPGDRATRDSRRRDAAD